MNQQKTIRSLYKNLLALYPQNFKEQLSESMEQTFNDICNERRRANQGLFGFVLWTFFETTTGIVQEHILTMTQGGSMKAISSNPKPAALVGFLFVLPFLMINAIVGNKIEPFFSFIRPGIHTGPFEYVWLAVVLLLIPIGAFIAVRPMFHKGINGKRKFYLLNLVIAIILLTGFVAISVGLGTDIYLCDVLQIPNCD